MALEIAEKLQKVDMGRRPQLEALTIKTTSNNNAKDHTVKFMVKSMSQHISSTLETNRLSIRDSKTNY